MLVNHAYSESRGVIRIVNGHLFAVFSYLALFRLIKSEKHTHKRRLSRTVFSQKSMDFSPFQLQGNIIVGDNSRKLLCYVEHFDYIIVFCIFHCIIPLFFNIV